ETFERYLHESHKRQEDLDGWIKRFIQKTDQDLIRYNAAIKSFGERVTFLAHTISTNQSNRTPITYPASDNANYVKQECAMKLEPSHDIPFTKVENFVEKVKRRIMEDNENREKFLRKLESEHVNTPLVNDIQKTPDYTRLLQELLSNKTKIEELTMVKLNARWLAVLQNELPHKEKDPGSFILPCVIGNTTVNNALVDLEASISMIPFSMFKRLGLGNPKPINMKIEMADRSMQSPKGIVKNVLVKIHNFIFPVDFVILDIIEDNKVPIILGRPMLATAHAKIDVSGKKISLEVGTKQIVIDDLGDPEGLEEVIINEDINRDLGNFLEENSLLPNFDGQEAIYFSPNDFEIDDFWDDLDPGVLTSDHDQSKPEFFSTGYRVHQHNPYSLQVCLVISGETRLLRRRLTRIHPIPPSFEV
ncbi:retrovirus-related pol polyprotein from transposon TNT 1-94, partial [Tanacetum coccineum]